MKKLYINALFLLLNSCSGPLFITKENIELYKIEENGKIGYIDQKGKIRIKPSYESCTSEDNLSECTENFDFKSFAIIRKNGFYGLINWKGEIIIAPKYDELIKESDSIYTAKINGKYGIINSSGVTIIPFIFNSQYFLDQSKIFPGRIENKTVIYNPAQDSIILTDYDYIGPFLGEFAEVKKNNKIGLINKQFQLILDTIYQEIGRFSSGFINVKINDKWEYLTIERRNPFSDSFEYASEFENGIATIKKGKYGAIDTSGKQIVPFNYTYLDYVGKSNKGEKIFMICNQEEYFFEGAKCGLISINGDTILSEQYSNIFYFFGIVEATLNEYGTSGVINTITGKTIIPFNFNRTEYYEEGLSTLYFSDSEGQEFFGYINNKNKIIWSNNKKLFKEKLKPTHNNTYSK